MKIFFLSFIMLVFVLSGCSDQDPSIVIPEASQKPYTVHTTSITLDCINKVAMGAHSKIAIRTQAEYDTLVYEEFQKPLDDWWNDNYLELVNGVKNRYPGLPDSMYLILARADAYNYFPFLGTQNCTLPTIDFTRYTLIGYEGDAGGCTEPTSQISVLRDDSTDEVKVNIKIIEHGTCERLWFIHKWLLVPKIPDSYTVTFALDEQ